MGMMGMFKWLRKDTVNRGRNSWGTSPKQSGLNNEAYRHALQAFIDRRRFTTTDLTAAASLRSGTDLFARNNKNEGINKENNERKSPERGKVVPGVPHVRASEIFEIGWVAGTEDRYLELIFAEWQNTRVSLKRHTHPQCRDAIKADLEVLTEIRHANILLLMATTQTDDHGFISIFESVECTLYSYVHDQGERISIQGIAKCSGKLADALRHSHMRGYIHGAISPHCVYLATTGAIKLGGWELAVRSDKPKVEREYEERLRTEIFKWQAPEIFYGHEPSKETDIYGLTLLIWEMCTMQVPWHGYSKTEVEKQYVEFKRGVYTNSYDFPPLLNKILEAGLQIEPAKRTFDVNRMRRFLQRLEMQYDDQELTYITEHSSNKNNESMGTYVVPAPTKPPADITVMTKVNNVKPSKNSISKKLFSPDKSANPVIQRNFISKNIECTHDSEGKQDTQQEQIDADDHSVDCKDDFTDQAEKNTYMLSNLQKSNNEAHSLYPKLPTFDVNNQLDSLPPPRDATYRKTRISRRNINPENGIDSVASSSMTTDTVDDESFKEARDRLKRLKETLAQRREHFFSGSDTSYMSDKNTEEKEKILTRTRSQNYVPHKPASHKTSLQPKLTKSPGEYDSLLMKTTYNKHHKNKDAAIQTQTSPRSQSFFEESLWKKEKLICISKMCKDNDSTYSFIRTPDTTTDDIEKPRQQQGSPRNDKTYVIGQEITGNNCRNRPEEGTSLHDDTMDSNQSSLQILKNALDRATDIIRSSTRNTDDCESFSSKNISSFDPIMDDRERCESVFEDIYKLKHMNTEIQSIEKSSNNNETLFDTDPTDDPSFARDHNTFEINCSMSDYSVRSAHNRNFICESIAELSGESRVSNNNTTFENQIKPCTTEIEEVSQHKHKCDDIPKSGVSQLINGKTIHTNTIEGTLDTEFPLMPLGDKLTDCNSCHHTTALARRRSLPAALGYLRTFNSSSLGRLPIRKGATDVSDNTVEDIYIDDEFGDSLNVNMILLNNESAMDDDFPSELFEL